MRAFLAIFALYGILVTAECLSPEELKYFREVNRECGMAEEVIDRALAGDFPDDQQFKNDIFCMFKKIGMQDDEGTLQIEAITEQIRRNVPEETKVNDILSKCLVQMGTPEETAYEACKCIHGIKHS
nr:odorant binding protein [Semanotus bifasciatus]